MTRINELDKTAFVIATPTRPNTAIHRKYSVILCSQLVL